MAGSTAVRQSTILVDARGRHAGIVTRGDLICATGAGALAALDAGTSDPVVTYPDESAGDAVTRMLRRDIGHLPVVSRDDSKAVVGYLGRAGVMAARRRQHHDEHQREGLRSPPARDW